MSRRKGTIVDNRPMTPRNLARRHKKPAGALALFAFLVLDTAHLHLIHHLLGPAGDWVTFALFLIAIAWGGWRLGRRVSR